MKNLLFVFGILMLACGTETEVAEESTPMKEEPDLEAVVGDAPPTGVVEDDGQEIEILKPDFLREDAEPFQRLDPVPLNQDGIFFKFSKDLSLFKADLLLDEQSLGWLPHEEVTGDDIGDSITVKPPAAGPFLEHDKKYTLELHIEDNAGHARIRVKTLWMMKKP